MPDVWTAAAGGRDVSLDEIDRVAKELKGAAKDLTLWLFFGEMGAGKTTLIKALAREFGVRETVSSPTFAIVHEYTSGDRSKIYHFDMYRLGSEGEAFDIGMDEYLDSGNLCWVEWPEKLRKLLPEHHFDVRIIPTDQDHRRIDFRRS